MKALILIIFSFNLYAETLEDCKYAYAKLGDGSGLDEISSNCKNLLLNKSNSNAKVSYADEEIEKEFSGYMNAILTYDKKKEERYVSAGSNTQLEEVIALFYDHAHKELYAIDAKSSKVLVFLSEIPGNVAPIRVLEKDELIGASDLVVINDSLYVLNTVTNKLLVYSRLASVKAREDKQFLDLVQSVDINLDATSISVEEGNLILQDKDGNKLSTLSLE